MCIRDRDRLVKYLARRKEYLGLEKMGWQDLNAPLGQAKSKMSYDEAAEFIVEQFGRFNPEMAEFAANAFRNRWIESEDRPGKRMGGFCTSFPGKKQSRIFVTFSGTLGNMATVAHELGHGFHQHLMFDLPAFSQRYAMNVAETASTFAEVLVADAATKHARAVSYTHLDVYKRQGIYLRLSSIFPNPVNHAAGFCFPLDCLARG